MRCSEYVSCLAFYMNTSRVVIARLSEWVEDVERIWGMRNTYIFVIARWQENRLLCRPRRSWQDNIKMFIEEIMCGLDSSDLGWKTVVGPWEHGNSPSISIKSRKIFISLALTKFCGQSFGTEHLELKVYIGKMSSLKYVLCRLKRYRTPFVPVSLFLNYMHGLLVNIFSW